MKKGTKIGIIIGASVVVVIVAVVLTLSLITTKPLESLADYKNAIVYESSTDDTSFHMSTANGVNVQKDKKLRALLKGCSYSVIQSIFSGRTQTANEIYYEDGEEVKLTEKELEEEMTGLYSKYDTTLPKLRLSFDGVRKAKIGNATYEFDTVEILVANTHGEIREITCVAWDSTVFNLQDEETEFKGFNVFKIHANTTELYNFMVNECDYNA